MGEGFTFAVIGHNEAARLHVAIEQALAAAGPGDRVWFVDSASDDDSAQVAATLGAEVVRAPLGKGRAVATALERCRSGYVCFVDGDMEACEVNVPATLRDAVETTDADMVVGAFTEARRRLYVTPTIYNPLVEAFFPECLGLVDVPLSGLRAIRSGVDVGTTPSGYGVETHLNLQLPLTARRVANCSLGWFVGPVRGYTNLPAVGRDVGVAILDLAEANGRLQPDARPAWDDWVDERVVPLQLPSAMTSDAT